MYDYSETYKADHIRTALRQKVSGEAPTCSALVSQRCIPPDAYQTQWLYLGGSYLGQCQGLWFL